MSVYGRNGFCATPTTGRASTTSTHARVIDLQAARVIDDPPVPTTWAPCISRGHGACQATTAWPTLRRPRRRRTLRWCIFQGRIRRGIAIPVDRALAARDEEQQRPRDLFVLRHEPAVGGFRKRNRLEVPRRSEPALAQRAAPQFDSAASTAHGAVA